MAPTDEDVKTFLYDRLIVDIIHFLDDYINNGTGTLDELKGSFRGSLPEKVRRSVQDVEQLVNALEKQGVIGKNNVQIIKLLAEKIGLQALVEKIKEYEYDVSGFITKIFKGVAGAVKTSAIRLRAMLSSTVVQATVLTAAVVGVYGMNPKTVENFQTFSDLRAQLLALLPSSVIFVLKVSSIASIKQLWKGYKDGSLKKSMKKDLNEMKELKELSKGEEIDVEVTIDEEEYHEVYWNLIISELKANDARQNDEKQPTLLRRHSIGCEQDVPKSSNLPGVSQLHIQAWRHIDELNKVLSNFKSIKAKKETSEDTAIALKEVISMVEQEEKRLSEIRQELSELNIVIDATGFEKAKVEEKAGLTVMHDKVEGIDSGASTSLQAEKDKKQSDQSTQVPHSDEMTYDEKLSDADVRKAGEKLEEQESFTQSVVTMRDKERMSEAQQLLLRERFSLFKDDILPTELLENLPCLTNEQKDQIAYDEKNHLPSKAMETLVEKLKEHKEGFEQFVEALRKAELGHVAALLDANYFGTKNFFLTRTLKVIQDKVKSTDLGAFTSFQAEEVEKITAVKENPLEEPNYDNHPVLAILFNILGNNYYDLGQHKEAQKFYERALAIDEKAYDQHHPNLATTLNNLGNNYYDLGQHKEAQKCYERALAIQEKAYDQHHPNLATALNNLGNNYCNLGQHKEAQKCLERALAIQEKAYNQHHPNLAATLNNLGNNYYDLGQYKEAQKCLEKALAIDEKAYDQDHPNLATTLNNLGNIYLTLGQHKEAQKCYERALAIDEKVHDRDHPNLAITLNNLGKTYCDLGQHKEAQKCLERALAIQERAYDQDHPNLAITLNNLGKTYRDLGQHKEAQKCYERALAIDEKAYDQHHPNLGTTLNNLGNNYYDLGQHKEAQKCLEMALAIDEKAYDQDHPNLAALLFSRS